MPLNGMAVKNLVLVPHSNRCGEARDMMPPVGQRVERAARGHEVGIVLRVDVERHAYRINISIC